MVWDGHAVVGAVGIVGVIGVIGVIGVAGRAFTRICGSGPATDAGQTGKVGIDAEASPGASAGTEGLVALEVLDNAPEMLEVGVTSALLLGDAVWFTGDLGGVGPAVFLDALVMGPAEFDIGPALGRGICCLQLRAKNQLTASWIHA